MAVESNDGSVLSKEALPLEGDVSGSTGTQKRTWQQRLVREVRTHPFGYVVLAIFVVAGPIVAPFLFPQAPPAAAAVGGLAFGIYAALCAVPQKFM